MMMKCNLLVAYDISFTILQLDIGFQANIKILSVVSTIKGVDLWKQYYLIWKFNDAETFQLTSHGTMQVFNITLQFVQHLCQFLLND